MSFTHRHSRGWSSSGATSLPYDKDVTHEGEENRSLAIPDGTTDLLVSLAVDITVLKALFIGSDQDITIETNQAGGSSGAPDDTLTLPANQPVSWQENDVMTCPLTVDVTQIYVTNASGSTANLEIRTLEDATP